MEVMLRRWPFERTFGNARAARRIEEDLLIAKERSDPVQAEVFDSHPPGATVLHLHHRLGLAYLGAGMPDEAAREFAIIASMLPNLPEVQILLAESLAAAGRADEAVAALDYALRNGFVDRKEIEASEGLAGLRPDLLDR